jgi:anti-sigma B factor antagonist
MKITCQHHDQQAVFTLRGELTSDEVDKFRKAMLDQMDEKTHDFVLDMSHVQFVDSKGLESLLWLQDQCLEKLGQIRLAACPDNVKTILRITRIGDAIQSHENIPEALKSLEA